MEVRAAHTYNQSVDAVFKHFADQEKVVSKHQALGARDINVIKFKASDTNLDVIIAREVPADVPGAMKKFLGEWNTVKQTESWSGTPGKSYQCDIEIDLEGVPVTIKGKMELSADGDGCVNNVCLNVTCGIPLVGKKLAEFVGKQSKESMELEYSQIKSELD